MVVKTSDNTKIIKKLPFHEFSNKTKYLNKYIEAENKQAEGSDGNPMESAQKQASDMMASAKNSMKTGNMKLPKH